MDTPISSGGNTNSGPLASRFFHPSNRSKICELILNSEDRQNYMILLSYFNAFLSIISEIEMKKISTR